MADQFHDDVIRELARLSAAVEAQGRAQDALAMSLRDLPCLDVGPQSHAVRLDRIEQAEARRQTAMARLWAAVGAAGAGLLGLLIDRLSK